MTQTSKMSESTSSLISLADLLTITEIRRSIGTDVFPAHKCPSMKFFFKYCLIIVKTEVTRKREGELIKPLFLRLTFRLIKWTVCKK